MERSVDGHPLRVKLVIVNADLSWYRSHTELEKDNRLLEP